MEIEASGELSFNTGTLEDYQFLSVMRIAGVVCPTHVQETTIKLLGKFDPEIVNNQNLDAIHNTATVAHVALMNEMGISTHEDAEPEVTSFLVGGGTIVTLPKALSLIHI